MPQVGHDKNSRAASLGMWMISIHVPQVGHDNMNAEYLKVIGISIHVPQVGHDAAAGQH